MRTERTMLFFKKIYEIHETLNDIDSKRKYFHGTLLNVMCQPGWEWSLGIMATCLYVAESLPCLPETTITLLIGYTPIPDKKFKL